MVFELLLPEHNGQSLYQQIYNQIREQIRSGSIKGGTRLPSVRALQLQLNISKTPIETAYQMLTTEGYAVSRPRSGLYAVVPEKPFPLLPFQRTKSYTPHQSCLR